MLLVFISPFLNSVTRYKFLIFNTYHSDTLYLREQGYGNPRLLSEAESSEKAKKFGEILFYVFKKCLGLMFHFLPLCCFLQVLDFNFLHYLYVCHIIIGQSKEYIHPCIGITNFLWEPGTFFLIPLLFFSMPLGLGLKKFIAFFFSHIFPTRHRDSLSFSSSLSFQ
jgi:hypothetical protein